MSYQKPKLTESEVSQEFDLKEIFDVDFDLPNDLVQNFGQDLIDRIIERTEGGKAIHGRNLKRPYSKSYRDSDEYKDFGKTGKVNMTLTGSMLDDIDIIDDEGDTIKIGFNEDLQNKKAFNHNVGDTVPKRPFFGINKKELKKIAASYKEEIDELRQEVEETGEVTDTQTIGTLLAQLGVVEDFFGQN